MNEIRKFPYGFQNGRMNLIRTVDFNQQINTSVRTAACRYGIEGLSLYNHSHPDLGDLQMIAIADFTNALPETQGIVRNVFIESKVRLFTPDQLDELKQEILTHAKPVPVEQ